MPKRLQLHSIAENELEAPALAWSSLAWYWGLSFLGIGPRYIEYMRSGEAEIDKAFFDASNDQINRICGYDKPITIRERFNRAVTYYEYCYVQGRKSSINPPWDYPPDVETLITFRERMEPLSIPPDKIIQASTEFALADDPKVQALWTAGADMHREETAREYARQINEATEYIRSEVAARMQLAINQLDKNIGFLKRGNVPDNIPATVVEDMDETMPDEKQWDKLGDVYIEKTPKRTRIVTLGIIGRYYTAGHNLETAMWNEQRKKELSGIHTLIVRTWRQLMDIAKTCEPTGE